MKMRFYKIILTTFVFVILVLVTLLSGEFLSYLNFSTKLEKAHSQIRIGISIEEVEKIIDSPDWINPKSSNGNLAFYWLARQHQGYLMEKLTPVKGHYDLVILFDENERVKEV